MIPSVLMPLKSRSSRTSSKDLARHASHPELSASLSEYMLRDKIGEGAFGKVFIAETLGRRSHRTKHVALKVIRRKDLTKNSTKHLAVTEIANLMHLSATRSMFFTQLVETFHDDHNLYIVTDLLRGGTLRQEMADRGCKMKGDRILFVMAQLVEVLAQLRAARIIHRDIKPDNILLDALGNITLADMGMSRRFDASESAQYGTMRTEPTSRRHRKLFNDCMTATGCGTLPYAAPEMFTRGTYSFQADVYSVGVIFHELLFGNQPHHASQVRDLFKKQTHYQWHIPDHCKEIKPEAADLCRQLLATRPRARIDVEGLRDHAFFKAVDWPTLAARAYDLPRHYAPTLAKIDDTELVSAAIFADHTVHEGKHPPNEELELAYSSMSISSIAARPDDPRTLRGRARKFMADLKHDLRVIHDRRKSNSGEYSVRRRSWAKDAKDIMGKPLVVVSHCPQPSQRAERNKEGMKKEQKNAEKAKEVKIESQVQFCVPSEPESNFHQSLVAVYNRSVRDQKIDETAWVSDSLHPEAVSVTCSPASRELRPLLRRMSPLSPGVNASSNVAICGTPASEFMWLSSLIDNNFGPRVHSLESEQGVRQPASKVDNALNQALNGQCLQKSQTLPSLRSNKYTVQRYSPSDSPPPIAPVSKTEKTLGVSLIFTPSSESSATSTPDSGGNDPALLFSLPPPRPSNSASTSVSASGSRINISAHRASLLRNSRTSYFPPLAMPSLGGTSLETTASTISAHTPSFASLSALNRAPPLGLGSSSIVGFHLGIGVGSGTGAGTGAAGNADSGLQGRGAGIRKSYGGKPYQYQRMRTSGVEVLGLPVVKSPLSPSSSSSLQVQDEDPSLFPFTFPIVSTQAQPASPNSIPTPAHPRTDDDGGAGAGEVQTANGLPRTRARRQLSRMNVFSTERLREQTSQEALHEKERAWRASLFRTTTKF